MIQWQIEGMTCTNCALGIQKMLEKKGASQVAVNYTTGDLSFHNDAHIPLEKLASDIEAMGYEVVLPKEENDAELSHGHQHDHSTKWGKLEKMFIVSAIFTIPLILAMFVPLSFLHQPAVQFALSLPVMLIGMYHFGRSAWSSIKIGVPNMDVLIIIGSSAAFFYSIYGWLNHLGHQYMFLKPPPVLLLWYSWAMLSKNTPFLKPPPRCKIWQNCKLILPTE
ncbi:MAG: cation-translocating P-type ATPase [Chitinophagales bacterium]|nr:cation-translocating P-type ATPase [Chitinophagales bacterium]